MNIIDIQDGYITINGTTLSAVVTEVAVSGKVIWKEQTLLLKSGKEKTFNGFDDTNISISLIFFRPSDKPDERYKHIALLTKAYKAVQEKVAVSYQVTGDVFKAAEISEVFFESFSYTDGDDAIPASITLIEKVPKIDLIQRQQTPDAEATDAEMIVEAMSDEEKIALSSLEGYYNE